MSTILKALRRLEEDRSVQGGRPLREEVLRRTEPSRPRRVIPVLAAALALCAGIAGGTAAYRWIAGSHTAPGIALEPAPAPPPAPAPVAEPQAVSPAPAELAEAPEPRPDLSEARAGELSPDALTSSVAVVQRPPAEPRIAEPEPEPQASAPEAAPREAVRRPGHRGETGPLPGRHHLPPPAEEPAPAPERVAAAAPPPPSPAPEPELSAPPPRATAPPAPTPAPVASAAPVAKAAAPSAPASPRAAAPRVTVERTMWHPSPERRLALVELAGAAAPQEVREGDAVGPLIVTRIEPSGVVFAFDGAELRRKVGE